jgi:hypothetical protein
LLLRWLKVFKSEPENSPAEFSFSFLRVLLLLDLTLVAYIYSHIITIMNLQFVIIEAAATAACQTGVLGVVSYNQWDGNGRWTNVDVLCILHGIFSIVSHLRTTFQS